MIESGMGFRHDDIQSGMGFRHDSFAADVGELKEEAQLPPPPPPDAQLVNRPLVLKLEVDGCDVRGQHSKRNN